MAISSTIRTLIFERDGYRCRMCGATRDQLDDTGKQVTLQCDHVIPVARGGPDDLDNLATLCQRCNRGKSDMLLSKYLLLIQGGVLPQPAERSQIVPPLAYQENAVRQIVDHLKASGLRLVDIVDFARSLNEPLRDGINPIFEPLSLATVSEALKSLEVSGNLKVEGETVYLQ